MHKVVLCSLGLAMVITPAFAFDDDNDKNGNPQAIPSVFVGKAGDCGASPGSRIVTSTWLGGLGLPDNGGLNTTAAANDPHTGLLLNKNGPTSDCSAAGAMITGVGGTTVTATSELGFDYRNGTHCGAGAPRFNLVTTDNVLHFIGGCANGTKTPAPQDPAQWTRVRFTLTSPANAFPPVVAGSKIKSLDIIFDEGTDATSTEDPTGVGLATIDNILVNGKLITSGPKGNGGNDDKEGGKD